MSSNVLNEAFLFTPTSIPGCAVWFDAADPNDDGTLLANGAAVATWYDKSSNGYTVSQGTAGNRPIFTRGAQNNLPGIQFATNTFLSNTSGNMSNFTTSPNTSVFIAARNASANTGWNIVNTVWFNSSGTSATLRYHFSFNHGSSNGPTLYINPSITLVGRDSANVVAPNSNAIIGFTTSSDSITINTNGNNTAFAGATLQSVNDSSTLFIFNDNRNLQNVGSNIMIFEMIGYSNQVTTEQRQQIEGYLSWKWGITTILSATNPYKISRPLGIPLPNTQLIAQRTQKNALYVSDPTLIPNLYLWLDGADASQFTLATGTNNILQWRDKSRNAFHANAGGNPVYNSTLDRVQFNGTTSYLSNLSYALNLSQHSMFIVMSENSRTAVAGVFPHIPNPRTGNDYSSTNGMSIETQNGLRFYMNGDYTSDIGNTTLLPLAIYNNNISGTQGSGFVNGVNATNDTITFTPGTCAGYVLGARWGGALGGPYLNGNIHEVIVYSSPLTQAQRQQVEGYLAYKWNLQGSLPSSNTFSGVRPDGLPRTVTPLSVMNFTNKFLPTSLSGSGLAMWMDAADTSSTSMTRTAANRVSTWRDKSGNGNATTTANGPPQLIAGGINGLSAIQTQTGNHFYMDPMTNAANTATVTAFVVATMFSGASYTYGRIISFGRTADGTANNDYSTVPNFILCRENANAQVSIYRNSISGANATASVNYNVPFLMNVTFDGTNGTGYLNGTSFGTFASSGTFAFNRLGIGVNINTKTDPGDVFNGYIGEVIVYYSALSALQRQQMEGYLAWKWGLQGNLPSTHPYKLYPPPP